MLLDLNKITDTNYLCIMATLHCGLFIFRMCHHKMLQKKTDVLKIIDKHLKQGKTINTILKHSKSVRMLVRQFGQFFPYFPVFHFNRNLWSTIHKKQSQGCSPRPGIEPTFHENIPSLQTNQEIHVADNWEQIKWGCSYCM